VHVQQGQRQLGQRSAFVCRYWAKIFCPFAAKASTGPAFRLETRRRKSREAAGDGDWDTPSGFPRDACCGCKELSGWIRCSHKELAQTITKGGGEEHSRLPLVSLQFFASEGER